MKNIVLFIAVIGFCFVLAAGLKAQQQNGLQQEVGQPQQQTVPPAATQQEQQWEAIVPEKPSCTLRSDVRADLNWKSVPKAQSFVVYWSPRKDFQKDKAASTTTYATYLTHKWRQWDETTMYYRVAAVRDKVETKLSEACQVRLLPSEGGRVCQICGDSSIGFCSKRRIYVCSGHNVFTDENNHTYRCP